MSSDTVIHANKLSKCYRLYDKPMDRLKQMFVANSRKYYREFWALRDVSLEIKKGQTIGVIGRNGAGKSTLLQMICGTVTPSSGGVQVNGRVAALLELGAGFNPEFTGRENVFLNATILGLSRSEVKDRFNVIADFSDIGAAIEQPIKTYSSGMVVRLAFAVAVHTDPDVLIVDEALAVGDLVFQARCLDHIKKMKERGCTTLFVTHDIGTFQTLCDYGFLLDGGQIVSEGDPQKLAAQYYQMSQERETISLKRPTMPVADALAEHKDLPSEFSIETKAHSVSQAVAYESRFGTYAAEITAFRIINEQGQQTKSLEVGKAFSVEIDVSVHENQSDLTVAVVFRNAQGQNLFAANTRYDGADPIVNIAGGSVLTLSVHMNMLLNPGQYLMHLGLANCTSDHLYTTLDNQDAVDAVSVFGKAVSFGIIHHNPIFLVKK